MSAISVGLWAVVGYMVFAVFAPTDWEDNPNRRMLIFLILCGPVALFWASFLWLIHSDWRASFQEWLSNNKEK